MCVCVCVCARARVGGRVHAREGCDFSNSNRIIPSDYRILLLLKMPIPNIYIYIYIYIYVYVYVYVCIYLYDYFFFYLMQFNFALSMRGLNIRLYLGPLYIPPLDATNANDLITLSFCECVLMYWCTVKPNDAANCPAILSCILNISLLLANAYFFSSSLSALRWRTSVLSAFKHHYHPCALI